ncbi:MAG TPA: hypothetical protein VGC13_05870 [Longimicrobium sp.]|jgi:hypothetical protein|uniref:hypothetical protein n=1 Tax=Longimicrobium sp. TaxID=2029185 RepID=UPI002ED911E9
MKRLSLTVEDLQVESFSTASAPAPRGTVVGHQVNTYNGPTCISTCFQRVCGCTYGEDDDHGTCNYSCHPNTNCGVECPTGPTYPGCA